ncbi:hypothetical protein AAVH_07203 [Aphelenchoides avenae]|nr:hypothetical protein AAVH_07203 [Aphelenchus avenae]
MAGTDDPENVTGASNDSRYFFWVANVSFPPRRYYSAENDVSGDIAVIELETPLNFSAGIQPICLAREFREAIGEVGHIVGFGSYSG